MAILVTGGAGYIGSHMVLALVERGEEVVVLDNLSTGMWWAIPPEARLVEGDIGDEALLDRVMVQYGFDAVVHFAGSIVVPDSVADPLGYYLNNTVKSRALMAAAVAGGVKNFIFSSTAAVYGNPLSMPVFESERPTPISPYGTSKLMTELMLPGMTPLRKVRSPYRPLQRSRSCAGEAPSRSRGGAPPGESIWVEEEDIAGRP